MNRILLRAFVASLLALAAAAPAPGKDSAAPTNTDWPAWRGPRSDGHADPKQSPPTAWSSSQNVLWKSPIPGRGHSSPIVVGNQIVLTTADEKNQIQFVICYDRATGKQLWKTDVHQGNFTFKNAKASLASSTAACDGERFFVNFHNDGAVHSTALSRDGKRLWQQKITDYEVHQGYGSSPTVYGDLLLVSADNKAGGAIAALNRETGDIVWRHDRPKKPNYASPIVLRAAEKEQLIFSGCDLVSSFDPVSGKKLWEIEGATTECVTSAVTDGAHVFTSGGYPDNHVSAIAADGSGKVAWRNNTRVYVPSMIVADGHLYAVTDAGVAVCWNAATGKEAWKGRLGGTFSSSLVLVGDVLYGTNEAGKTYLFRASPEKFELITSNQLGDEVFATPAITGSRIYHRVAEKKDGQRQEMLYCLGSES